LLVGSNRTEGSGNAQVGFFQMNQGTLSVTGQINVGGGGSGTNPHPRGLFSQHEGQVTANNLNVGTSPGSLAQFSMSGGSFTAQNAVTVGNGNGNNNVSFTLSGGSFTSNGNFTLVSNANNSVTVSGGTLSIQNGDLIRSGSGASTITISGGVVDIGGGSLNTVGTSINFTGGLIRNVASIIPSNFTVNGPTAVFAPNVDGLTPYDFGGPTVSSTPFANTGLVLQNGGSLVFTLFGDGQNDSLFNNGSGNKSSLVDGSVVLHFADNYTPEVGHSFDLLGSAITRYDLVGDNIASTSYDQLWEIGWDTSAWLTDGVLTIETVAAIPEPSTYALLAGLLVLGVVVVRRRLMVT
jgi:hypothetical protein